MLISVTARNLDFVFWEDRAAHMASCQVPLIVALAGKNNVISCQYLLHEANDVGSKAI